MKKVKITIEGVEVDAFWLERSIISKQKDTGDFITFLTICFEGQVAELSQIADAVGQEIVLHYFK